MNLTLSNIVWGTFLLGLVALEILGIYHVFGLITLSGTSWADQDKHKWLAPLLFGFLLGLVLHITFLVAGHHIALWRAVAVGLIVAFAAKWLLGVSA